MAKQSILDARMQCPECESVVSVGLCEPDIDGEGSLGCPCCLTNENKRVAMKECKPVASMFSRSARRRRESDGKKKKEQ